MGKDFNVEDYNTDELLDFLNESDTYFVEDKNIGIVGNKKTGVMFDKRTGKVFSEDSYRDREKLDGDNNFRESNLKYDFLDYKRSIDVLNNSDHLEKNSDSDNKQSTLSKDKFVLRRFLNRVSKNKKNVDVNKLEFENKETLDLNKERKEDLVLSSENDNTLVNIQNENIIENSENSENSFEQKITAEDLLIDINKQSDEEILNKINEKFNNVENEFLERNASSVESDFSNNYDFSSFEDNETIKKDDNLNHMQDVDTPKDNLSKFRTIIDFEDYLSNMIDDESILKSPFDDKEDYEAPKVVVEENNTEDDLFSPFDGSNGFEVEEIQSYDVNNENALEEGMLPDFNLNQSMSKKVSIREVIKNKQKKKQEQKELQKKLFFETLDERIEEFKNFKESTTGSQEILNAINMDLNRINSSIKIEFDNLNKKRKFSSKKSKELPKKDEKFSLQNLLEEIYEENGEKPSGIDTNELDIEAIKNDLAEKENSKNVVN